MVFIKKTLCFKHAFADSSAGAAGSTAAGNRPPLLATRDQKTRIGLKIKRLIDHGRVLWIREAHGGALRNTRALAFCDASVTVENTLLLGSWQHAGAMTDESDAAGTKIQT